LPSLGVSGETHTQAPSAEDPAFSSQWKRFVDARVAAGSQTLYDEAIALTERQVIAGVLSHTGGNQVQASKILGITRTTLRSKMRSLGITLGRVVHDDD